MSSEMSQPKSTNSTQDKLPEVHDLDQIISQITANGEFQEMMNSLSDGLKTVEQTQTQSQTSNETITDTCDDNSKHINTDLSPVSCTEHTSNYDICATFFADDEGNNVCESLQGVQKSLEAINENLTKLVSLVYQHKTCCPKLSQENGDSID